CTKNARHVQEVAPWIDPGLTLAVHGALALEPAGRWGSIEAFANALAPFAGEGDLRAHSLVRISNEKRERRAPRVSLPMRARTETVTTHRESETLVGALLAGRYQLIRPLGKGGMGAVYEAVNQVGKHLAVKVILADADERTPEALARFSREARAASEI